MILLWLCYRNLSQQVMDVTVISLERELEELKKRLAKKDKEINEVDIDRLKYIEEEFRMVLPE